MCGFSIGRLIGDSDNQLAVYLGKRENHFIETNNALEGKTMNVLTQAQKAAIAKVEAEIQANASDEDWYVEDATANNNQVHDLKNGYTAQREGNQFKVMKDGKFVIYAVRLKAAKDYVKSR